MKNNTLNFFKAIACVMVLLIHVPFSGVIGDILIIIARFGVPFFFMVSGYYSYKNKDNKKYIKRQLLKILKLSIFSILIYSIVTPIIYSNSVNGFEPSNVFNFMNLKFMILFNNVNLGYHLWYLLALLYVYLIYYVFTFIFNKNNILYIFIPILMFFSVFLSYLLCYNFISYNGIVVRNFLFIGLPFFMLGNLISKNKKNILYLLIKNTFLIIMIIVSLFFVIFEYLIGFTSSIYLSSIILAINIFVLAEKNPTFFKNKNLLVIFGEKYSLSFYISHVMVYNILNLFFSESSIYLEYSPFIVFSITLVFIYIYYKIKGKIVKKLVVS